MTDSKDLQKLRMLLPAWIRHNAEHAAEFRAWARKTGRASIFLEAAADHVESSNFMLKKALEQLGDLDEVEVKHDHQVTAGDIT